MQAQTNYRWLARDGWAHVEEWFNKLAELRSKPPNRQSQPLERDAARFAMGFDPNTARKRLMGLGPKQARNLWQWLGLTRYEIPLDSRVTDWINRNLTAKADGGRLSDENYYVSLLDYLQEVCDRADVLPCVFDAAAFDNSNSAAFANLAQSVNSSQLGTTTIPGYINRNRQITIRNTGLPGTDHLQYVYQVACTNCGHTYGANGSDLYDRKCPLCRAGVPGLPLALTAHA